MTDCTWYLQNAEMWQKFNRFHRFNRRSLRQCLNFHWKAANSAERMAELHQSRARSSSFDPWLQNVVWTKREQIKGTNSPFPLCSANAPLHVSQALRNTLACQPCESIRLYISHSNDMSSLGGKRSCGIQKELVENSYYMRNMYQYVTAWTTEVAWIHHMKPQKTIIMNTLVPGLKALNRSVAQPRASQAPQHRWTNTAEKHVPMIDIYRI
jgi:hypothetical protein